MKLSSQMLVCITIVAVSLSRAVGDDGTLSISPTEFAVKSCATASDVVACKLIVNDIIKSNPRDEDIDASKVALESARQVQSRYGEVADDIKDLVKVSKDPALKTALSNCFKMYEDIAHAMGLTISHLKKENEVCKAREFASSADANPRLCEEQLVQAGTTGKKLRLYKDFNDLQDMAGACDSIIAYMIKSKNLKTEKCINQ